MAGAGTTGLIGYALLLAACAGRPASVTTRSDVPPAPAGDREPAPPSGWRAKLADPRARAATVKELRRLYEDTAVAADGKRDAPEVRALVDRIVSPLVDAYVAYYADMDPETRVELIRLLGELDDPRIAPAIEKAFQEFAKAPTGDRNRNDVQWAARAARELRLTNIAAAVLAVFSKLRASTPLGGLTYRDLNAVMVATPDPSWTKPLMDMLARPIVRPRDAKDTAAVDAYRDQLFWQTTAAQVLGELRAESAIDSLVAVTLSPDKADVQPTAVLALVRLGKSAVARVTPLLARDDARATAAIILGSIGRGEAEAALIAAAASASDVDRAIIARELTKLPPTAASKAAFLAAFAKTPLSTSVLPGVNALEMLADAAGQFHDPAFVGPLYDRARKTTGNRDDAVTFRSAVAVTLLKLARPDQLPKAKAAVDQWGTALEKKLLQQATELAQRCAKSASCYVGEMANAANQTQSTQFIAIKAGYMAVVFADAKTRDEILTKLDAFENRAVRFVAAQAIDHLSPTGSREAAATLRAVLDRNAEHRDPVLTATDAPLRQVLVRLEARAE